jgi:hypothetical protein
MTLSKLAFCPFFQAEYAKTQGKVAFLVFWRHPLPGYEVTRPQQAAKKSVKGPFLGL